MIRKLCLLLYLILLMTDKSYAQEGFVKVEGQQFRINETPYYFLGANFWYGMHLGMAGEQGDRERLVRELDLLKAKGVNNLRIMGASEGPDTEPWRVVPSLQSAPGEYNEEVLEGLDFLLAEMGKRKMYAVVCLNNFWAWSGGMSQYLSWANAESIPYHPPAEGGNWVLYQRYASGFYKNREATKLFENHVRKLVSRVNSITGVEYKEDPTIMSWQLANEPRSFFNGRSFRRWVDRTAQFIKILDKNHLVSLGSEGNTNTVFSGTNFKKDHKSKSIDYATIHIWIQNWTWYNPQEAEATFDNALKKATKYLNDHAKMARQMNKPLVLEEFGIARDLADHDPKASVDYRDMYLAAMFEEVYRLAANGVGLAGCNFWAWGGEGRPSEPKAFWKPGDDLIGDPPHEHQGWYSVYDTDASTLEVISRFSAMFQALGKASTGSGK